METWSSFKSELLKDPEINQEYERLAPYYELASHLIDIRIKNGFTQSELAAKIGTAQSSIARLESGRHNPSLRLLEKVAAATGTRLSIKFI